MADTPPTIALRCPACGTWATNTTIGRDLEQGPPRDGWATWTVPSPDRRWIELEPCGHRFGAIPVLVGEPGPELPIPPDAGTILPTG